METQTGKRIRNYSDKEMYQEIRGRCERWIICYPDAMHQLLVSNNTVYSLQIIEQENLFEKSLTDIRQITQSFEFAMDEFQQVHAVIADTRYTLVPDVLFDADKSAEYYKLLFSVQRLHTVHFERFKDMVCLYQVNDLFHSALRLALPGVTFHHYIPSFLSAMMDEHEKQNNDTLYVNLFKTGMDIFCMKDGKLSYHNHFPFESDTDVVYFLLSVAETILPQIENWKVELSGDIMIDGSLHGLMKKYIPKVSMAVRPKKLRLPSVFRDIPAHQQRIDFSLA